MIPTARCLSEGFWRRSLNQFKRGADIAFSLQGIKGAKSPYVLVDFGDPDSHPACKAMSDADIGGFSEAHADLVPAAGSEPAHLHFHGKISTQLPTNRLDVQRTGYAGWRTLERGMSLFGKAYWDIDPYKYLGIRFKSDGRRYFVNLQTDSIVPTDLHQHRLTSRTPGEWETVLINWNDFVRTNHGIVVEPQSEMMRNRVKTVGLSLIDRVPGPFDLKVSKIWASNGEELEESKGVSELSSGGLRQLKKESKHLKREQPLETSEI